MAKQYHLLFLAFGLSLPMAQAATVVVPPGAGTLKNAVDAANSGDVLLLQAGDYNMTADIAVDVGITIRPQDNTAQPRIILNGKRMTLKHTAGTTTLQKLGFIGGGRLQTDSARKLNILENTFTDVSLSLNYVNDACYFIGNTTGRTGTNVDYSVDLDADCYTAGNSFNNLYYLNAYSGYFIGNKVISNDTSDVNVDLWAAYAIGNVFVRDLDNNSPTSANRVYRVARFKNPQQAGLTSNWPLITNNIFRVIGSLGNDPASPIKGMVAVDLAVSSQFQNNIIDYAAFQWPTQGEWGMIWVYKNSTVQGNIVVNGSNNSMPSVAFSNDAERTQSDLSYNDCHNNALDCGNTDGNISADPDFVDSIDYVLNAGSVAIDAGPTNDHLNDLDGSRNDMGVHGGPSPIAQYKAQLESTVTAPYVYPVFKDIQTLSGAQVEVTAIGVARFK